MRCWSACARRCWRAARSTGSTSAAGYRAFDDSSPSKGNDRPYGYSIENGVATVPIHGVLVRRAGQVQPDSTILQSYEERRAHHGRGAG